MKTLSIIIPLYNKEKGISNTLNLIETKCSEMKISYEILIIENESTDNSFDIANNYGSGNRIIFIVFFKKPCNISVELFHIKLGIKTIC